jgi:hypothetical protein
MQVGKDPASHFDDGIALLGSKLAERAIAAEEVISKRGSV